MHHGLTPKYFAHNKSLLNSGDVQPEESPTIAWLHLFTPDYNTVLTTQF